MFSQCFDTVNVSRQIRPKIFARIIGLFAAGALCATSAHASLILTIDQPIQSAPIGTEVRFSGSITNTGPDPLGLIDLQFSPLFTPPPPGCGVSDCPPFELGLNIFLLRFFRPAPGQSFTGTLFSVRITETAAIGQIMETLVTIRDRDGAVAPSAGTPIRLSVAPDPAAVPEPTSMLLVAGALTGGALIMRRRVQWMDHARR